MGKLAQFDTWWERLRLVQFTRGRDGVLGMSAFLIMLAGAYLSLHQHKIGNSPDLILRFMAVAYLISVFSIKLWAPKLPIWIPICLFVLMVCIHFSSEMFLDGIMGPVLAFGFGEIALIIVGCWLGAKLEQKGYIPPGSGEY